jgi:tetratricopeptide (TPR) repeat protein
MRHSGRSLVGVLVPVAFVACGGLLLSEQSAATHERAVEAYNLGDWAAADGLARRVLAADPAWAPYEMTAGLAAAAVGDHERAASAFRHVATADDLPEAWVDLAAEELALGSRDAARDALVHASRLGLQRPAIAMAIGDLALRLGEPDLSGDAFAMAIAAVPGLAGDPWWHADPERSAVFPDLVDAAIEIAPPGADWQIAMASGDLERARALQPSVTYPSGAVTIDDVIDAWEGQREAAKRVIEGCGLDPTNSAAIGWCARISQRNGDTLAANRFREWSYLLLGDTNEAFEVRVSGAPILGRAAQGGVAEFWGTYTYRRATPWNLLVPTVVQLTLA